MVAKQLFKDVGRFYSKTMEHSERPTFPHLIMSALVLMCLFLLSCSNNDTKDADLSFYRNMSKGIYNVIAEVKQNNNIHTLTLRGTIDKQPIEVFRTELPSGLIDTRLGDINADGIPEIYCLGESAGEGEKHIHAFTLDGPRFEIVDVKCAELPKGHKLEESSKLEIQDNHLFHHFASTDSTGDDTKRKVGYSLQKQNGNYQLLPKPELKDMQPVILNSGLSSIHVGDTIEEIELPANVEIHGEEREFKSEDGPSKEWVYTLVADGLVLMDLISYEGAMLDEIFLHDTHFRTVEGIGVQSRLTEFISTYPNYKLWYTYVSDRFIAETPVLPNVQFLVERDAYAGPVSKLTEVRSEQSTLSIEDFTGEARIEKVRIF